MSRWLIIIGMALMITGLIWPWLSKLGLGRLPGDITLERENIHFYFPLTTSIIVSIALSLIFWLFRK